MTVTVERNKIFLPIVGMLQQIAFVPALFLAVVSSEYPLFGKLAWLALMIICGFNIHFAFYAVFFFSAFFIPTVFTTRIFFTIKHFHISLAILLAVFSLKGYLFHKIKKNLKSILIFIPWFAILFISVISSIVYRQPPSALSMTANILSLVISYSFLICILDGKKEIFLNALLFFVFGGCIRIILAGVKSFFDWPVSRFAEPLIHNTHIGFLASSSLFLLLPFILTKQDFKKQLVSWPMLLVVSLGLLLSCSRTAWSSALISYFLFCILLFFFQHTNCLPKLQIPIKWFITGVSFLFFVLLLLGMLWSQEMVDRLAALQFFLERDYWQYIFQDQQNFGPFGFFRLAQFSVIKHILKHSFLFGIGLSREVTDFHCLYLTLFGGTGFIGLFLFLSFCFAWAKSLFVQIFQRIDDLNLFRIGVLCAFSVWLISSLMETFMIQFNVWIVLTAGIVLARRNTYKNSNVGQVQIHEDK